MTTKTILSSLAFMTILALACGVEGIADLLLII